MGWVVFLKCKNLKYELSNLTSFTRNRALPLKLEYTYPSSVGFVQNNNFESSQKKENTFIGNHSS